VGALDKLVARDLEEGTLPKLTQWRRSLAIAEARVEVVKLKLAKLPWSEENERELSDASGAAAYCRAWLKDHR
jgi:hypothetical protein